jgi:hypothetical protein
MRITINMTIEKLIGQTDWLERSYWPWPGLGSPDSYGRSLSRLLKSLGFICAPPNTGMERTGAPRLTNNPHPPLMPSR